MQKLILLIAGIALILATGCGPQVGNAEPPTLSASSVETPPPPTSILGSPTQESLPTDRISILPTKFPERVPPTEAILPVSGEVPDELLNALRDDLMERTGAPLTAIHILQAQEMIWNDGSFGCPQPGVLYTQSVMNGYQVIFEVDGKQYDYRAANKTYFFLCEENLFPIAPPNTPQS